MGGFALWKAITYQFCIASAAILAGCGGGGGDENAPQDAPAAACIPLSEVSIEIWGDSTNHGSTIGPQGVYRVAQNPEWVIQTEMDRRFGVGVVHVATHAVPGSSSRQMLEHMDGNAWPPVGVDITLVNHGINDWFEGSTTADFRARLKQIAKLPGVVLETPLPLYLTVMEPGFASVVRDVAKETGVPLIDVSAYAAGLPSWPTYLVDGIHPASDGYGLVTRAAVLPKLTEMVAKLRCQ